MEVFDESYTSLRQLFGAFPSFSYVRCETKPIQTANETKSITFALTLTQRRKTKGLGVVRAP